MGSAYALFLRGEAVSLYRALRRHDRERLERFFDFLESNPHSRGQTTESDEVGRTVQVALVDRFKVVYWVDHAAKEVKILRVDRSPRG